MPPYEVHTPVQEILDLPMLLLMYTKWAKTLIKYRMLCLQGMLLPHSNTYQRVTHFAGKLRTVVNGAVWLSHILGRSFLKSTVQVRKLYQNLNKFSTTKYVLFNETPHAVQLGLWTSTIYSIFPTRSVPLEVKHNHQASFASNRGYDCIRS